MSATYLLVFTCRMKIKVSHWPGEAAVAAAVTEEMFYVMSTWEGRFPVDSCRSYQIPGQGRPGEGRMRRAASAPRETHYCPQQDGRNRQRREAPGPEVSSITST